MVPGTSTSINFDVEDGSVLLKKNLSTQEVVMSVQFECSREMHLSQPPPPPASVELNQQEVLADQQGSSPCASQQWSSSVKVEHEGNQRISSIQRAFNSSAELSQTTQSFQIMKPVQLTMNAKVEKGAVPEYASVNIKFTPTTIHTSTIDILACQYIAASLSYLKSPKPKGTAPQVLKIMLHVVVPRVTLLLILEKDSSEMPVLEMTLSDQVFVFEGAGPSSMKIDGDIKFHLRYFDSKTSEWDNIISNWNSTLRVTATPEDGMVLAVSSGSKVLVKQSLTAIEGIQNFAKSLTADLAASFPAHDNVRTFRVCNNTGVTMYLFDRAPNVGTSHWKALAVARIDSGQQHDENWSHKIIAEGPSFQVLLHILTD